MIFESQAKRKQPTLMPQIIGIVVVAALIGGGFVYYRIKTGQEKLDIHHELLQALGSGSHTRLSAAMDRFRNSSFSNDEEMSRLTTEGDWILWAEDGIKPAGGVPDGAKLDVVNSESPLTMIIARAERDLLRRDLIEGKSLVQAAMKKRQKEPALQELMARYTLHQALEDLSYTSEASGKYFDAMDAVEKAEPEAKPVSRSLISYGYAVTCELQNNFEGAVNNYDVALSAEPTMTWATLRQGMVKIPHDSSFEEADAALLKLLENVKDLSPRQKSAVHVERARWAINTYNIGLAIDRLKEAAKVDGSNPLPPTMLGMIYLDSGKLSEANAQFEAAGKIAPFDVRVISGKVSALLAVDKVDEAEAMLNDLPDPYKKATPIRTMNAAILRHKGETDKAAEKLGKILKKDAEYFDAMFQRALLELDKKGGDPAKAFNDLMAPSRTSGHAAIGPVLQAYAASAAPRKLYSKSIEEAIVGAEAEENARALAVVGQSLLDTGDKTKAAEVFEKAKGFGDWPAIAKGLEAAK